jgi:molybdopterin/thiamine biosynthesis adenylyltransferase
VNLLARQFKVVARILLDVPAAPLRADVAAFGTADSLVEALENCVHLVAGPHVQVRPRAGTDVPDVTLTVGASGSPADRRCYLYADGWRYFIGSVNACPVGPPASELALGPYMCASYAAGEVFKLLRGLIPGKGAFVQQHFASLWTMSETTDWSQLEDGPRRAEIPPLGHFYLAGAGAVAQAAAACLGASRLNASCTTMDADPLDTSNDNRYVLAMRMDKVRSKAQIVADYLNSRKIPCTPLNAWWEDFTVRPGRGTVDEAIRNLERSQRYQVVLSCVDKNAPRHSIQNALPGLIVGGSTYGLQAKALVVDLSKKPGCLMCFNPVVGPIDMIRDRIQRLSQADAAERECLARQWSLTATDVERLMAPEVRCGHLSTEDRKRFAGEGPAMSVGFVSLAAGVLLAAQWLRHILAAGASVDGQPNFAVASFVRPDLRARYHGAEAQCSCNGELRERWRQRWRSATAP